MVTGFMGIEYSTDEIKNGRFVDATLESDFIHARYEMLRSPQRRFMNESAWRNNTVDARKEFLQMMKENEDRNRISPYMDEEDDVDDNVIRPTDTFTYVGEDHPPKEVKTIIIGSDVKEIEDGAFKDLPDLKSVVFPDEMTDLKIGKNAFENCPQLTTIRLNGIIYIGDEAFLNCTGLVSVELGSSIQHIGMGAFKNCTSLVSINVPPNVSFIGDYAFANCSEIKTASFMENIVEVSAYCFQNCPKLEQVMLPTSIEKVGNNAFENCPQAVVYVPTTDMEEAEELLGVKMTQRAEEDPTLFKCDKGFMVKLYKDLY